MRWLFGDETVPRTFGLQTAKNRSLISASLGAPTQPSEAGALNPLPKMRGVSRPTVSEPVITHKAARGPSPLLLATIYGEFGTIGLGEPSFFLKTWWNRPIANHAGVAQLIEREQFRRECVTPSVSLAALLIDAHLQRS